MKNSTISSKERLQDNYVIDHVKWLPITIWLLTFATLAFSQTPESLYFQGVARDSEGKIITGTIRLQFIIHKDTPLGEIIFSEQLNTTANSAGIFNVLIGQNTLTLPTVDWSSGWYYLQTKIATNPSDPSNYTDLGSVRFQNVPYSFYANEALKLTNYNPIVLTGDPLKGTFFPTVGTGARFIWHPQKAAFRAGSLTNALWENHEIGENSFAAGKNTWAKGDAAIALGLGTVANSDHAVAVGSYNDIYDNSGTERVFEVGNGINNLTRKNAFTVLRNGNVGIGEHAKQPAFKLDVDGRARVRFEGNLPAGIHFNNSSNQIEGFVGMANDNEIGLYSGGKWLLVANKNGTVYMDNYYLTSDKRKKTGFTNLSGSLGKLMQVNGYHYRWLDKKQSQVLQTGLIAQEVEKLFPELVNTNEDGNKSLNYNGLIPHLIEAVKELKIQTDEIAALRKEVIELKMLTAEQRKNTNREGISTGK